jgi:Ser/Thr protein kinase RdoA (MazF antagonist)
MTAEVQEALGLWGLAGARCDFVAGRENRVYRVFTASGDYALRFKRPGYRQEAELRSELEWLDAMDRAGLHVPRPLPSLRGKLLESVGGAFVDVVGWLPGAPLGKSRDPLRLDDRAGTFRAIGAELARLHDACDAWQRPAGFRRCDWDVEGLLGADPVWGRFWENPTLDTATRQLFLQFRQAAHGRLTGSSAFLDYGLIHADLVRENILLDGTVVRMIDFDDGGFGYRQFDVATILLKNIAEPDYPALRAALVEGYRNCRALDLSLIDLFLAIRALTYVGWITPRMQEDGGAARNARFVAEARGLCVAYLQDTAILEGGG